MQKHQRHLGSAPPENQYYNINRGSTQNLHNSKTSSTQDIRTRGSAQDLRTQGSVSKHQVRTQELDFNNVAEVPPVEPKERKGRSMYLTCRLFLVMVHRTILLAAILIGGTFAFKEIENHYRGSLLQLDMKQSAHFCYTVLTTIGYGKITPLSDWGKVFTIAYAVIGIPIMLFALGSYGSFLCHCVRKMIMGFEYCCCKCWKGQRMNLKIFIFLILLLIAEVFCFAVYIKWLHDGFRYIDSVYTFFVAITTIGFYEPFPYPIKESLPEAFAYFMVNLFCLITLTGIYEAVQGMIETVNNNQRGPCAIMFCCYSSDKKDDYNMTETYQSPHNMKYSEYVQE